MAIKDTLLLGVVGAAGIFIARKIPTVENLMDQTHGPWNRGILIPDTIGAKNGWSAPFWIVPALGAWYLSR